MKKVLLYFSCLFLVFSCKAESKNNLEEKKGVISNNSVISSSIQQQEDETWYFYGVSQSSVIQSGIVSREDILEQFKSCKIQFSNDSIKVVGQDKNIYPKKTFHKKKENVLSYWNGEENVSIYKNILKQENIKLPNQITVIITGSNLDDAYEYPFNEFIKLNDVLFLVYNDYLIFFSKKESIINSNNCLSNFNNLLNNISYITLPVVYESLDNYNWKELECSLFDNMSFFLRLPDVNGFKTAVLLNDSGDDEVYNLITIKNEKIIDSKNIGYVIDGYPENNFRELVYFNIDENFVITLLFKRKEEYKLRLKVKKMYKINNSGKFEEIK